jgi:hypothetical protein
MGQNGIIHFFFTYEIRNVPFNIQYYITIILLDFPLSDYYFPPKSGKIIYLCGNLDQKY